MALYRHIGFKMNDVIEDWHHRRRSVASSPWLVERRILYIAYWESPLFCIFQLLSTMQRKYQPMHYIRYGNSVLSKFMQHLYAICCTGCPIKWSHVLLCWKASKTSKLYTQAADIRKTVWLSSNVGIPMQLKLTTGRRSLIKQQILMYKTAHQKHTKNSKYQKRWYCSAVHRHSDNVMLC